jgi:hypothetical protein
MKKHCPIIIILSLILIIPFSSVGSQSKDITELMKEAVENVEKYRKGDVENTFNTSSGTPVVNATVKSDQISQDFLFGNIIFPLVGVLHKFRDMDVYRPKNY